MQTTQQLGPGQATTGKSEHRRCNPCSHGAYIPVGKNNRNPITTDGNRDVSYGRRQLSSGSVNNNVTWLRWLVRAGFPEKVALELRTIE